MFFGWEDVKSFVLVVEQIYRLTVPVGLLLMAALGKADIDRVDSRHRKTGKWQSLVERYLI